ncbi:MAG: hypothetical protein PUC14_06805 [Bacteroidales bacterium]|nr:hypothetical protein [Bacteroidales bacterium]MDY5194312.1 hypothetical protein [Candidatus Aphodosoma sp.]
MVTPPTRLPAEMDFVAFIENPDKTWNNILAKEALKAPPVPRLCD